MRLHVVHFGGQSRIASLTGWKERSHVAGWFIGPSDYVRFRRRLARCACRKRIAFSALANRGERWTGALRTPNTEVAALSDDRRQKRRIARSELEDHPNWRG